MSIKQISVILDEQSGTLSEMTKVLADKNVEMRALTFHEAGNFSVARIIVDNVLWTASHLKTLGYPATFTEVVAVSIFNSSNEFCHVLEVIKDAGINVEYAYSLPMRGASVGIVFEVDNAEKASEVLTDAGIKVITQDELSAL